MAAETTSRIAIESPLISFPFELQAVAAFDDMKFEYRLARSSNQS